MGHSVAKSTKKFAKNLPRIIKERRQRQKRQKLFSKKRNRKNKRLLRFLSHSFNTHAEEQREAELEKKAQASVPEESEEKKVPFASVLFSPYCHLSLFLG